MVNRPTHETSASVTSLDDLAKLVDYSLMNQLNCDPQATDTGEDYMPRQVFSGHYVPVKPMPIGSPKYVAHSKRFFEELGFDQSLVESQGFSKLFSGDMSLVPAPMKPLGWATGYALSIYGREYIQQCPFQTGNGYGDGRAVSIVEAVINGKRWEMQLKGGGRTPYCRGADGRAVLRSSVREFLAQEYMHALGVPTSRSLCLYASQSERVDRPWYSEGSYAENPDIMISNPVAISTRVAPSFLRVGQVELFGRRARGGSDVQALEELKMIVLHLIDREYPNEVDQSLPLAQKLLALANAFSERLTALVSNWMRVGYCQGNFNSDNCAAGGFTLDYGPFGFCERFEPYFQPWTGGGDHFSFLNQPAAAETNFNMFCVAIRPLLQFGETADTQALAELESIRAGFVPLIKEKVELMWAEKLGLKRFDSELFRQLVKLMVHTSVDYTIFFRELSNIPDNIAMLEKSFYETPSPDLKTQWNSWLQAWRELAVQDQCTGALSLKMKQVNPKYTWREWLVVPAYQQAEQGNYALIHELQEVFNHPYDEQSPEIEAKYYRLKPEAFFDAGGVSHYSCSS